ncbi:unnamed protein product [Meloidogyne enterolobii]|uniref:Uncharacterized protein n=1 Tax=Meloidogyne enterolobii TaxID=390850 RepID=A0ACB0Y9C8_MELEN
MYFHELGDHNKSFHIILFVFKYLDFSIRGLVNGHFQCPFPYFYAHHHLRIFRLSAIIKKIKRFEG